MRLTLSLLSKCILWISVLFFVLSPVLKVGSLNIYTLKVFSPFMCLIALFNFRKFPRQYVVILVPLVIVLSFTLTHYTFAYYKDSEFLLRAGMSIFMFTAAFVIVRLHQQLYGIKYLKALLLNIVTITSINALVIVLQTISPSFLGFMGRFIEYTAIGQEVGFIERINGLSSVGGAVLSVVFALSIIILHFYKAHFDDRLTGNFWVIVFYLCNTIGIVFSGRSGLIVLFLYFIYHNLSNFDFKRLVKIAFAVSLLLFGIFFILDNFGDEKTTYISAIKRSAEIFVRIREEGTVRTDSTDDLQTMFILPTESDQILIGNGNFGRNKKLPYVSSDVFYVRTIYGVGLLGLAIFLVPYFFLVICVISQTGPLRKLILIILTISLVLNIKEIFYFGTEGFAPILFLIVASLFSAKTYLASPRTQNFGQMLSNAI